MCRPPARTLATRNGSGVHGGGFSELTDEAKDELARDQERADRKAAEVANLERKTS
jgi:hypothetical protein